MTQVTKTANLGQHGGILNKFFFNEKCLYKKIETKQVHICNGLINNSKTVHVFK